MTKETHTHNKYIVFSMKKPHLDVEDVFRILNVLFLEAHRLGRIPVVGQFMVRSNHNSNSETKLRFDDYLDLSKGVLRRRSKVDRVFKDGQTWVKEEEFDIGNYAMDKVSEVSDRIISQEMNEKFAIDQES